MSKKYKYKYSELYCFEPEWGFPLWVSFEGKDAREVVNRWVSKYPCFRGLEEGEEEDG